MPEGEQNDDSLIEVARPGAVISPGSAPLPAQPSEAVVAIQHDEPAVEPAQPEPAPPPPPPEPVAEPLPPEPATPEPDLSAEAPVQPEGSFFRPEIEDQPELPESDPAAAFSWTASEFVAHDKSAGWYFGLVIATAILAFFVYLVARDLVSITVLIVVAIIFGVYASHKPRELEYNIDHKGLTVGRKHYGYELFKSFSVVPEGSLQSIVFMPLKRFGATLTVYYPAADEEKIMAVLTGCLPYQDPRRDAVDSLMKKIRF